MGARAHQGSFWSTVVSCKEGSGRSKAAANRISSKDAKTNAEEKKVLFKHGFKSAIRKKEDSNWPKMGVKAIKQVFDLPPNVIIDKSQLQEKGIITFEIPTSAEEDREYEEASMGVTALNPSSAGGSSSFNTDDDTDAMQTSTED